MPRYQPKDELREARTRRKLSQKKLAELLGTKAEHIGAWERGEALPDLALLDKLCALLAMPASQLGFSPELYQKREEAAFPPQKSFMARKTIYPIYDPAIPLPSAVGLIGRDDEFAWLKQHLCSADNVTTALNGLPGVGKTTLAIALAHDPSIRAHFHDGILWAGLGPNPNVQALFFRWTTLLGISTASTSETSQNEQTWKAILRDTMSKRALLLVLDDVWKVEHAHALQVGGPYCRYLVTTRFPTISAQMTIEGGKAVHEMDEQESMLLLQRLAPRVVELEPEKTRALVHAVGGLPLALTLMSNYLRIQSYSGQRRRIQMALERLLDTEQRLTISEPYWPVESHPSLQAETSLSLQSIIAVTDHELSLEARTAFYALAIFPPKPNSFSEEAALAATACTTQTLDALSDVGLVESSGSGRYTLHQAIADYARLHLDTGLFATSRDRLIAYVANFVKTHKKDYELLELESNTIRAALDMAYESELTAPLVQLVCACAPFLILRGLYLLTEKYLKRAYAVAQSLNDSSSIAEILLYLGETAQHKGDYAQAETYLQEGLASARQVNNSEHMCALLTDLGGIARRRGNYVQAEAYLQEGLTLARQIGDSERASVLLSALGTLMNELGNYTQAEIYLQNGLKLMRVFGDREQISTLLCNLGVMLGQQGKYQQAEKYFRESLELAHQIGYRELVALLLVNLGDAISKQGNYVQAETYLQEGLEVARQIGHREWTCALLMNLAEIARAQTRYTQAEKYLQEGLSIAQQIGRLRMLLYATYEYGNLSLSRGQIEAAEEKYRAVLAAIVTGDQDLLGLAQYGLAQVAASRQDTQKARQYGEASVNILVGMGHEKAQEVKRWLESLPE